MPDAFGIVHALLKVPQKLNLVRPVVAVLERMLKQTSDGTDRVSVRDIAGKRIEPLFGNGHYGSIVSAEPLFVFGNALLAAPGRAIGYLRGEVEIVRRIGGKVCRLVRDTDLATAASAYTAASFAA